MGEYHHHQRFWLPNDFYREYTKCEISSADFLTLATQRCQPYHPHGHPNLQDVYQKIAAYTDSFLLFTKTERGLVLVLGEKFLGRPHELPEASVQLMETTSSEYYFYPADLKFMGRIPEQRGLLDLAMPYVSVNFWERGGFGTGQYLHIETVADFEKWNAVDPTWLEKYPEKHPVLTRTQILDSLDFLLRFIPSTPPMIVEETSDKLVRK